MAARHSKKELFNDLVPNTVISEVVSSEQEGTEDSKTEENIKEDMEEMSDEQLTAKEQYLAAVKLFHQSDEVTDDKHVKRICVTLPPDLYDYLCIESRRRGMRLTGFLNMIVKEYKNGENAHILL